MSQAAEDYQAYFGNADATNERIRKALEAGLSAELEDIYLPSGLPSGAKYRKIETPLETALRWGWITAEQKQAGEHFLRHMIGARAQIKFTTSSWEMPIDGGGYRDPMDKKRDHEIALRRALHSMHWRMRQPFLDWMSKSAQDDTNIAELGEKFTNAKHKEAQKHVGVHVLGFILSDLGEHFGYIHSRNAWDTRKQLEELLSNNRSQRL